MSKRISTMCAAALLATTLVAGAAYAQQGKVEITPWVGYRWGGGMSTIAGVHQFDTKEDMSYGLSLDVATSRQSEVNLYWSHFAGDWEAKFDSGLSPIIGKNTLTGGPIKWDNIQLNGTWFGGRSLVTRPYLSMGLGGSVLSGDNIDTHGFFTVNIGAGIKRQLGEKLALRIDGRWFPTWITTGTGVWCDPWYCYTVGSGEYYDQFQLGAGLSYALR